MIYKSKQELQAQADELQKQLNALSEKIANCKDEPKMFPQEGEEYWFSFPAGGIERTPARSSGGRLNAFRTKEEAQKAADIQWAKQRVAHRIAILNDGWVPDWDNREAYKYYISRHFDTADIELGVGISASAKIQPDYMYCKSHEIAIQVIDEYPDDLLLIVNE